MTSGKGGLFLVNGEWIGLQKVADLAGTSLEDARKAMYYGSISAEKFINLKRGKVEEIIEVYSKRGEKNTLARYSIDVDSNLQGDEFEAEVSRQILKNCIGWRQKKDDKGTD
jgi:hypothetical protein